MSYNIDGKIVNQPVKKRMDGQVLCGRCSKAIKAPTKLVLSLNHQKAIFVHHYIGSESYLYETKKGYAVMYCSNECRRKHNHRY
jgi:hypothetical protein